MKSCTLTFFGAAGSVTGSCTLVQYGGTKILVDCGTEQAGNGSHSFLFDLSGVQAVILTHGHLDHSGRVVDLVKHGFNGTVYGQYATIEIAQHLWEDSAGLGAVEPEWVHIAKGLCQPLAYGVPFTVGDIEITLHDAGHILGSSHVALSAGDKNILFSGDIGVRNTPIIRDPTTKWDRTFDCVVIESTYGNREHKNRESTIREFADIVRSTIAHNGILLIPSFAIGRTQEMLFHFNTLVESGTTAPMPVFIDSPLASKITSLYRRYRDCYDSATHDLIVSGDMPLEFRGLTYLQHKADAEILSTIKPPFTIIAGSGMCTGGRILNHLKSFASHKHCTIAFVGYQASGTLGRKLIDGAQSITIDNEDISIRATTKTLGGFSAHADQRELLEWASAIPTRNCIWLVNHGEQNASTALAAKIDDCGLGKSYVAYKGMEVSV